MRWWLRATCLAVLLGLAALLGACGREDAGLTAAFPGPAVLPGYQPQGEPRRFDRETIFQLVDGQADAYFAYRFEEVAVRSYEGPDGAIVDVELWRVASPADAYGLFTAYRAGQPLAVGNEGETDPGRRVAFWQGRVYVRIRARQDVPQADLERFAAALAEALPQGGERPALVARLPAEGLAAESVLYFHEELSIQDRLWLGGENRLGLSAETEGVLAEYRQWGEVMDLLIIRYPTEAAAAAGLEALQALELPELVTARVDRNLLGAVFGALEPAAAEAWLGAMLAAQP